VLKKREKVNMSDDLKLPQVGELTLPRWQYWLARYNEVLSEKSDRIEKLEAALRSIAANACCDSCREAALVARKALEGKE
jgi:hypothetical protein